MFMADTTEWLDYVALANAGYRGGVVSRYIAPKDSIYDWKRIRPGEDRAIRDAGMAPMLNFETGQQMARAGAGIGHDFGLIGKDAATAIGYAGLIPYSDDTQDTFDAVAPFYEGIANAVGPQGYYGGEQTGLALLERGLIVGPVWVAMAASWSGYSGSRAWANMRGNLDPRVHIVQALDHPFGFAGAIDHNEVLRADFLGGDMYEQADRDRDNATAMRVAAIQGFTDWFGAVVKGDPTANKTLNFITDVHNAAGAELDLLNKLVAAVKALGTTANPGVPVDPQALATALAPLLEPSERKAVADVLHSAAA